MIRNPITVKPPIWVGELELSEPVTEVVPAHRSDGLTYNGARLLVRLNHLPIGYVEVDRTEFAASSVADTIWTRLFVHINAVVTGWGEPPLESLPLDGIGVPVEHRTMDVSDQTFVSVVLCTRDRPEGAVNAIAGLVDLRYDNFEIVVVDNAPSTDATRSLVEEKFGSDERVRYVLEPRPGLSCARNRGVFEAHGEIIAFTDDDVVVDRWWLQGIVRGFRRAENVACVTGLIPSAELENDVQLYFDQRVTWGSSCVPRIFDLHEHRDSSPLYPYSPGIFGTGANFAMNRVKLLKLGGFDEALGAGAPAGGGEDLDIFMRTVLAGYRLVYEPSAIISHIHRVELDQLRKQMFTYGSGLSASFTALVLADNTSAIHILRRVAVGMGRLRKIAARTNRNRSLPPGLITNELRGMAAGPVRYLRGRRAVRRQA